MSNERSFRIRLPAGTRPGRHARVSDIPSQMSASFIFLSPREKKLLRRFAQCKSDYQIGTEIGGNRLQVALDAGVQLARRIGNLRRPKP